MKDGNIQTLGAVETKLLYTLHWILLDAAEECAEEDYEKGIFHLSSFYYLFSIPTMTVSNLNKYCFHYLKFFFCSCSCICSHQSVIIWKNRIFKIFVWKTVWKYGRLYGSFDIQKLRVLRRTANQNLNIWPVKILDHGISNLVTFFLDVSRFFLYLRVSFSYKLLITH